MFLLFPRARGVLVWFAAATIIATLMTVGVVAALEEADATTPPLPQQSDPTSDKKPSYLQRPRFVDTRFADQIKEMREAARTRFIDAGKWLDEAKSRRIERNGQVEIKKREIDTIEAKLKLAKKTGAEEEKVALEAEKKLEQELLNYLKQLEKLEGSAEKRWTAAKRSAGAEDEMHGLQLDLAGKRAQRDASVSASGPQTNWARLELETRDLVRRTLESMKKAAAARRDLAGKESDHIDHQLQVLKSWVALTPAP